MEEARGLWRGEEEEDWVGWTKGAGERVGGKGAVRMEDGAVEGEGRD